MIYNLRLTTLYLFSSLFFFSACTERIDIDLNNGENNKLTVEGGITNEAKVHTVKLTRSGEYFLEESLPLELNALVTISDNDSLFVLNDENNDGIYETEAYVSGIPGKEYTLNIQLADGERYSATSYMNFVGDMDSINYEYAEEYDFQSDASLYFYKIYLYAQEPETVGDYYIWDLYIDDIQYTDTLKNKTIVDDTNINGSYLRNLAIFWLEQKEITQDETNIKVSLQAISKQEYDYNIAVLLETVYKGGPFDGPPANVPSNISNGALGFFSANSITYVETTVFKERNP